jgi:hypothetical protein
MEYKITGLKELEDALKDLPAKMQASVYRSINRKAVKKYVSDSIRLAVNYSNETEKGITVVNDRQDPTGVYGGVTSDSFWLRFADRGTALRQTEKGASRGQIIGKNQIQPIIEGSTDDIIKYMNEELGGEIEKILQRRIKAVNKKISKL